VAGVVGRVALNGAQQVEAGDLLLTIT